jgi:hypothetical protein
LSTPPEFARPATSEAFAPRNHPEWHGKLFLIRPNYVQSITFNPEDGPKDTVNSYVVILDLVDPQTNTPTVIDGATIGGAALVPQLRSKIGQMVLGRLEKGPSQGQKDGAFKLNPNFTQEDAALAGRWLEAFGPLPDVPPAPAPTAPPAAPAAPPADMWAGTNAAPAQGQWGAPPAAPAAPPAPQWGQAPAAPAPAPAPAQGQWGAPAAPAAPPAPAAPQWGQAPAAPAPQPQGQWGQPQAPAPGAPAPQWGNPPAAPAPAAPAPAQAVYQDPALVARIQAANIQVTPDMDMNTLQMIAASLPQ